MIWGRIILLLLAIATLIVACAPMTPHPKIADLEVPPEALNAASPPVHVRTFDQNEHDDFELQVQNQNLPDTTLESALIAIFPFPVSILALDTKADIKKKIALRIARGMTIRDAIDHLSNISGYQIVYTPEKKIVKVASLITRAWHLPALIGRPHVEIELGRPAENDEESGDDNNESSNNERRLSAAVDSDQNTQWDAIVNQTNCIMETPACQSNSEEGENEDDSGSIGAQGRPAADGSLVVSHADQGVIIVTAPPGKMQKLSWLSDLTKNINRFVRLQVAVISSRYNETKSQGVDLEAVLNSGDSSLSLDFDTVNNNQDNRTQFTINTDISAGSFNIEALLDIFDERTDAEVIQRATLIVANGETATINSVDTFYFASGSEIIPGNTNNQQVVSTDLREEKVGIEIAITPRFIKPNSNLMSLRILPIISELIRFDNIMSNDSVISSAPRIALNNLISHSIIRDGQAIIIGGLVTHTNRSARQDFPGGALTSLFDSGSDELTQNKLFIVISAQEIDA